MTVSSLTTGARRRWAADEQVFRSDFVVAAESPSAMDSWLVEDGRTRAFDRHAARFTSACTELGIPAPSTAAFLDAAVGLVPSHGRWFPRVELVTVPAGGRQFQCWLRPAPSRGESVRLWVGPYPDRRRWPRIKGPDQAFLSAQRQEAIAHGADDAVLLSDDGSVRETTSASLLWWRGDTLCTAPGTDAVLSGVTAGLLREAACNAGIRVVEERLPPAALIGLEVWTANALHGIRPVIGWSGTYAVAGPAPRAAHWNERLDQFRSPTIWTAPRELHFPDPLSSTPARYS